MATDSQKNYELESALKSVINVLEDGQKGMAEIGEHLKDEALKRYFLAESLTRANFRGELENELHRHGVADVHESGTAAGALHRAWAGAEGQAWRRGSYAAGDRGTGRRRGQRAYKDALRQDLPLPVRQLLTEQQTHILTSHDFVRSHRDALKAA